MTEKQIKNLQRKKNYQENLEPYKGGRELNNFDKKILKILVDAKFEISDTLLSNQTNIDMEQIERTQRLQSDINIILHIWKKADGKI